MTCYYPLKAYKTGKKTEKGKNVIVFKKDAGSAYEETELPCGQCLGCRIQRSRDWAVRACFESSLYSNNCMLTLTYSDKHLPKDHSLKKRHLQLFFKKLRKNFKGIDIVDGKRPIRYIACGEYGDKKHTFRPHYHVILFNFDFIDKTAWVERKGYKTYRSVSLEGENGLWPYGNSEIGTVTFESAAYVARYVCKKITGKLSNQEYSYTPPSNDKTYLLTHPYITMSRRPGIAREWFKSYKNDCYPKDRIHINGKSYKVPKYFDNLLELEDKVCYEAVVRKRRKAILDSDPNERTLLRKAVKRRIKEKQCINLKRPLEEEKEV